MLNFYFSSAPDSSGGDIAAKIDINKEIIAHVEAIPFPSTDPSTCYDGRIYRKLFLQNDGTSELTNLKIKLARLPETGNCFHALSPSPTGHIVPEDTDFEAVRDNDRTIEIISLAVGEAVPIWFVILWSEASGWTTDVSINFELDYTDGHEEIELLYKLDLYIEPFTKDPENDYTSWLKDMFILFLRNALYQTPRLDFRWHPNPDKTKIFISDRMTYNLEEPETRPSIVVIRGGLAWRDLVMDQMRTYDMIDRTSVRTDLIMGNINLQCVAREGLHAESLATMVFKMMKFYKDDLRSMGLHEIQRVNIGEEVTIMGDTRPEATMVPVNVSVVFQDAWKTWINWPRLRGIDLKNNIPEQYTTV